MKKALLILTAQLSVIIISCKKEETPATAKPSIEGQWKYESNVNGSCTSLVGTVWEIKNGASTNLSVPSGAFGFSVNENMLKNIAQTTSPTTYTANGYSRSLSGSINNPNILVNITVSADVSSMTVNYGQTVCNPVQKWVKTN
jgi:hypothetical protein